MITTFTVFLMDTPTGEAELIKSNCNKAQVLHLIENEPSRYSVQEREWEEDMLIETLNGEEWLDQYTT